VGELFERLHAAGYDDLRPAHAAVFANLRGEGSRAVDVADRAGMTKQSMGYLVDYLVERGYLERMPDPTDGRAQLIRLTPRGWDAEQAGNAAFAAIEAEWSARLGDERWAELRTLLTQLLETLTPEPKVGASGGR
jgi:DNA-binding MarR family transcriptional regulator